jgi:hypothetical protein
VGELRKDDQPDGEERGIARYRLLRQRQHASDALADLRAVLGILEVYLYGGGAVPDRVHIVLARKFVCVRLQTE